MWHFLSLIDVLNFFFIEVELKRTLKWDEYNFEDAEGVIAMQRNPDIIWKKFLKLILSILRYNYLKISYLNLFKL